MKIVEKNSQKSPPNPPEGRAFAEERKEKGKKTWHLSDSRKVGTSFARKQAIGKKT